VHQELQKANAWSSILIGAAIEVHRLKGPGLLEPIYRKCVRRECELRNIPTRYELIVPIEDQLSRDGAQKRNPPAYSRGARHVVAGEFPERVPRKH
jgi:hypothetical protein